MQLSHYLAILTVAASAASAVTPVYTGVHHNVAKVHHEEHKFGKTDLKQVASHLHSLSAHLEHESNMASKAVKLNDRKLVAVKLNHMVKDVRMSVDQTTASIRGLMAKLEKRDVPNEVSLAKVSAMLAKAPGCERLTSLLNSLDLKEGVEADVASIMSNIDLLSAIHSIVNVSDLLHGVTSTTDSVRVLEALRELQHPLQFVSALKAIESIPALLSAAREDVPDLTSLVGGSELVKYVDSFGSSTLVKLGAMTGANTLLTQIKAVVGSEIFVTSLASVPSVERMVAGLHAVPDMPALVSSVQTINSMADVGEVLGGLSQTTSQVGLKRGIANVNVADVSEDVESPAKTFQKVAISKDTAKLTHAVDAALQRREEQEMITASLISVNKEIASMIPKLEHMLHKLDVETDVNSAAALTITSLVPHFLEFTTVLTVAIKHGAPQLLPHVNRVTKITDGLLVKLAHLQ